MFVYNDVVDASGNVVVKANRNAKYPNLRWGSVNSVNSTFWRVSGYLRDKSTLNSIKMKAEQEGQLATEAAQEAEGGAGP